MEKMEFFSEKTGTAVVAKTIEGSKEVKHDVVMSGWSNSGWAKSGW